MCGCSFAGGCSLTTPSARRLLVYCGPFSCHRGVERLVPVFCPQPPVGTYLGCVECTNPGHSVSLPAGNDNYSRCWVRWNLVCSLCPLQSATAFGPQFNRLRAVFVGTLCWILASGQNFAVSSSKRVGLFSPGQAHLISGSGRLFRRVRKPV